MEVFDACESLSGLDIGKSEDEVSVDRDSVFDYIFLSQCPYF